MVRMKPAALLRQSKKQKAPARFSVTTIAVCNFVIITLLLSIAFFHRHKDKVKHDDGWMETIRGGKESVQFAFLNTTKGIITLELYSQLAPEAVKNFVAHSQDGMYNGGTFHRVIKGFMIQGHDRRGVDSVGGYFSDGNFSDDTGAGHKYASFTFVLENHESENIASQFYITTVGTSRLDKRAHTVAGAVVHGQDVVQDIENSPTDSSDQPLSRIDIYSINIRDSY